MSRFVLDCSVAMSWCFEDEATPKTDALLIRAREHGAHVPAIWHWEVANVLMMAERKGRLAQSDASICLSLLSALPISTDQEGASRARGETLLLARSHRLTVYDVAYLELALRLGCDLATTDLDLRKAAKQIRIGVAG